MSVDDNTKHPLEETNEDNSVTPKKAKLFSAKAFRKELRSKNPHLALNEFLNAVKSVKKHDYITEYLESGGSCLELLQILETDSTTSPVIIFELLTYILLKINSSCPQHKSAAFESCNYLLKNFIAVITKMTSLSSTTPERKACLKLLTAMVTFSSALARDVLIQVQFHSANMELLTKHVNEKDSVRDHFIRFITAFLVDGNYSALSILLDRKGFLTSIVRGLRYDAADTVCMVLVAMKNFILENPYISKTAKMKVFNTVVIKDMVNLYNWKGPEGLKALKKDGSSGAVMVDEVEKSKVNECVHDFLLILCTSHKLGVIFKDRQLGFGKKNHNTLMFTVLESLDRPWDHSYAGELVIQICAACPDLTKTVWANLAQFLEPRLTDKWLSAVNFARNLIRALKPECIEHCIKDIPMSLLIRIVQLISPITILKAVIPENKAFDSLMVKSKVLELLLEMLCSFQLYLNTLKTQLDAEKHFRLKFHMTKHVSMCFPDSLSIISDWEKEESNELFSRLEYIENIFNIFDLYKFLSPRLLETLTDSDINLSVILQHLEKLFSDDQGDALKRLQIKTIDVFIDIDKSKFTPSSPLFHDVTALLLKHYYQDLDADSFSLLRKVFNSTSVFDDYQYEVNIWLNGVLDLPQFDVTVCDNIIEILKISYENYPEFLEELSSSKSESAQHEDYSEALQNLLDAEITHEKKPRIRHRYLSPMMLGLIKFLGSCKVTKALKVYVNFVMMNLLHSQTETDLIVTYMEKINFLSSGLKEYALKWHAGEQIILNKSKGKLNVFEVFSTGMLTEDINEFLQSNDLNTFYDLPVNLLDMIIFYSTSLLKNQSLPENIADNFAKYIDHLIEQELVTNSCLERIFGNPTFLQNFSFLDTKKGATQSSFTKLILKLVEKFVNEFSENVVLQNYLKVYKEKLVNTLIRIIRKPKKYSLTILKESLHIFSLDYAECYKILQNLSALFERYAEYSQAIFDILTYSLRQITSYYANNLDLEPLEPAVIQNITKYFTALNNSNEVDVSNLSETLLDYLKVFRHSLEYIDEDLFDSLVKLIEFHKENVLLAVFLLKNDKELVKTFDGNLEDVITKKWIMLPLLEILIDENKILETGYYTLETTIVKALEKPQKAGQYLQRNYEPLQKLIEYFMPVETCENFVNKIHKYEVTEVFHVKLLHRVYEKVIKFSVNSKKLNVIILNLVHLQLNLLKRKPSKEEELNKLSSISDEFDQILTKIATVETTESLDLSNVCQNDSFQLFCKFSLKYGVSGQTSLLKTLTKLLQLLSKHMDKELAGLIMEMLLSHSEFLDNVLGDHSEIKLEIWRLFQVLCENWNEFMVRSHVPILLASYRAMVNHCDKLILRLLKMYEKNAAVTKFYDFKPFLWGKAAAMHYSVKINMDNVLLRQPKVGDVLDILQDDIVRSTIMNYPLREKLRSQKDLPYVNVDKCYDMTFLLPLFSHLLGPEQRVATYLFTKSGALSLTVACLSSHDEEMRQAAAHILSRFYFHVEARQSGKDNLLWMRYVEAVCKGVAPLPKYKLNNYSSLYLARMALILNNPNHVMYVPVSQHLTAKSCLNFTTVPELYTFLHSSDVNYKEHRIFILELIRDGTRTNTDFVYLDKSMGIKFFSELYSSVVCDNDTRGMILDVMGKMCSKVLAVKILCENHSFLVQLKMIVCDILNGKCNFFEKVVTILLNIAQFLQDDGLNYILFDILKVIYSNELFGDVIKNCRGQFFQTLYLVKRKVHGIHWDKVIEILVDKTRDPVAKYLFKYWCRFVDLDTTPEDDEFYYLKLLIVEEKKESSIVQVE